MDSDLNRPVEFSTIYISGTTSGTVSNNDGYFFLQRAIFPCELIIGHVSYNTMVINLDQHPDSDLMISITPKVVEMNEVAVIDRNLREKNIQRFKDGFLGVDFWGRSAILENDSVLRFTLEYYDENNADSSLEEKTKSFKVEANASLNISLPLLGYDLQYDLIRYIEKYNPVLERNLINVSGYCYYKPKETDSKLKAMRYKRNRLRAYYFSPQHFTRSLYNKELPENGYSVYEISNTDETDEPISWENIKDSCMSYTSYEAVISGLKDHKFYIRYFSDYIGSPVNLNKTRFFSSSKISKIYFIYDECIIRKDGTRPGESIIFGPGIGNKRVGAGLPHDYEPGE